MGRIIANRFELLDAVGAGGAGDVYTAIDLQTGARVAIKQLQRVEDQARFVRECFLLASLNAPNVVRHVAHGAVPQPWLAMEWVEGRTLAEFFQEGRLSTSESLALMEKLALAVGELHARGIIHRDIKPGNVSLRDGDPQRPVLIDLGLARTEGRSLTSHGSLLGTIGYMAPEQARGSTDIDSRADVFSLGCLLFRCIAGVLPFAGEDALAIVLRISLEQAPRLRTVSHGVDPGIDELCARLLAHERSGRPKDAREVAELLRGLSVSLEKTERIALAPEGDATTAERRMAFLVVSRPGSEDLSVPEPLGAALALLGLAFQELVGGSLVVVVVADLSADELALRAARAALYFRYWLPDSLTTITLGRVASSGAMKLGDAADKASSLTTKLEVDGKPGSIAVDVPTARLLADRFVVRARDWGGILIAQHAGASLGAADMTGEFIGREATLRAAVDLCVDVARTTEPRSLVIVGADGAGKSRLARELLGTLALATCPTVDAAAAPQFEVWILQGDPLAAATPFSLLSPLLYTQSRITRTDKGASASEKLRALVAQMVPDAEVERVAGFLGELLHLGTLAIASPSIEAARRDATLMGDQIRRALTDLIRATAAVRPLLIIIEDLQWGDTATLATLNHAARALGDAPLAVLGLARPEGEALYRAAFQETARVLPLANLDVSASERLARGLLGGDHPAAVYLDIAERSTGNPFFVEELVRAIKAGDGAGLPATVVSVVESRLERLSADCRRAVRAASVYGQFFWAAGVCEILGEEVTAGLLEAERAGIVRRCATSRYDHQEEWAFRQRLFAEVSYEGLSEGHKQAAHRIVATWFDAVGEGDPTLLAEHLVRAGDESAAGRLYAVAAHLALEATDLARAVELATKAIASGATGEELGVIHTDAAEAHLWQGDNSRALVAARQATSILSPGSAAWCRAATVVVTAAARTDNKDYVDDVVDALEASATTARGDLAPEHLILLAEAAIQAVFLGEIQLADKLLSGTPSGLAHREPRQTGWLLRAKAWRALAGGDPAAYGMLMRHSASAFDEIGDRRNVCVQQVNEAYSAMLLGRWEEATRGLTAVATEAADLGLDAVTAVAEHNLGYALLQLGRAEDAERTERRAILAFERHGDRRMWAASLSYLARILSHAGRFVEAERAADEGLAIAPEGSPTRAVALAVAASVVLDGLDASGQVAGDPGSRLARAHALSHEAATMLSRFQGVDEGEVFIRTTLLRAMEAAGHTAEAREISEQLKLRIDQSVALLLPKHRRDFLTRVPEIAQARAIEQRLSS